ncbi:TadE/TadG family type IV pilus assembly protein [Mesorhizobium delmotii]
MRHFGGLFHAIGSVAGDRSGNLAVLFGMVASVLALGVGFAVNISQLYNAKSSLQGVIDAAVTSTARDLTTGVIKEADANKSVQAFLDANSRAGILQADRIVLDKLPPDATKFLMTFLSAAASAVSGFNAAAGQAAVPVCQAKDDNR